jgi:hypothetical protein
VDQAVAGNQFGGLESENTENQPLLAARQWDRRSSVPDFYRSEYEDLHVGIPPAARSFFDQMKVPAR